MSTGNNAGILHPRNIFQYGMPVLNWEHPIASHVRQLWVLSQHGKHASSFATYDADVGKVMFDVVNRRRAVPNNTTYSNWIGRQVGVHEGGLEFNRGASGGASSGLEYVENTPRVLNNSVDFLVYRSHGTGEQHSWGVYHMGNRAINMDVGGYMSYPMRVYGDWFYPDLGGLQGPTPGTTAIVAVRHSPITGVTYFENGVIVAQDSSASAKLNLDDFRDVSSGIGSIFLETNNEPWYNLWLYGEIASDLSDGQIRALSRDPLALVQPSRFSYPGWIKGHALNFAHPFPVYMPVG